MSVGLSRAAYRDLMSIARRHAGAWIEADDLVQEALLAALQTGREVSPANGAWLAGVMRNIARANARRDTRRRRREASGTVLPQDEAKVFDVPDLAGLPRGLRIVALLSLGGHNRAEIRYLLRISDEALRQRVHELRRRLKHSDGFAPTEFCMLRDKLAFGAIRQSLLPVVRRKSGDLASHDPDGHLIAFRFFRPPPHETGAGGNKGSKAT
jgi:RNA polymerase sigma-70 factor (ECF subfamily)